VYHIVSSEWFKTWQKYVGIEEEKLEADDE
jgi:hypothetical protein